MPLTTRLQVTLEATHTSALDLATTTHPLAKAILEQWASGTGADQADQLWSDQRTINASSSENLDLAGSLTDAFGATITFARIKLILVIAADANTNDVAVGGAASNQFINWVANSSDIVNVKAGGVLLLYAPGATGYAVTSGTGDQLKIANGGAGTSVTYQIVLIGASA